MTLSQIYLFNFEKLTTSSKTTIRNKLLRNSSWIRQLCLGPPSPHYVILISNIIWDHAVDIFCVLIFPRLSNGHLLLLYLVSTPIYIVGAAFCQQLQFYWGFNCVILHFLLLRKKHELQVDQKEELTFLDLSDDKTRPIRKVIFSVGWMWERMAYLSVTLHSVIKVGNDLPCPSVRGPVWHMEL